MSIPNRHYSWPLTSEIFSKKNPPYVEFHSKVLTFHLPTRWAPTSYKWSDNPCKWPYKWVTGVITAISGAVFFFCQRKKLNHPTSTPKSWLVNLPLPNVPPPRKKPALMVRAYENQWFPLRPAIKPLFLEGGGVVVHGSWKGSPVDHPYLPHIFEAVELALLRRSRALKRSEGTMDRRVKKWTHIGPNKFGVREFCEKKV